MNKNYYHLLIVSLLSSGLTFSNLSAEYYSKSDEQETPLPQSEQGISEKDYFDQGNEETIHNYQHKSFLKRYGNYIATAAVIGASLAAAGGAWVYRKPIKNFFSPSKTPSKNVTDPWSTDFVAVQSLETQLNDIPERWRKRAQVQLSGDDAGVVYFNIGAQHEFAVDYYRYTFENDRWDSTFFSVEVEGAPTKTRIFFSKPRNMTITKESRQIVTIENIELKLAPLSDDNTYLLQGITEKQSD